MAPFSHPQDARYTSKHPRIKANCKKKRNRRTQQISLKEKLKECWTYCCGYFKNAARYFKFLQDTWLPNISSVGTPNFELTHLCETQPSSVTDYLQTVAAKYCASRLQNSLFNCVEDDPSKNRELVPKIMLRSFLLKLFYYVLDKK